jgi:serine phosphatase RsbU (regulator of sigma subunit)
MSPLLDADSYAASSASIPFVIAAVAVGMVVTYALFMRGAPQLRIPVLVYTGSLLPFVVGCGLAVAAPTDEAAVAFYRVAIGPVPLATAGGMSFQLALAQQLSAQRVIVALAFVVGMLFLGVGWFTTLAVDDVIITPSGLRFFSPGPIVAPASAAIAILASLGTFAGVRAYRVETSVVRRRQLGSGILALGIAFTGLVDVFLAYGIGWAPVSWLFVATSSLLMLRSILIDDLLRARAFDSRAPMALAAGLVAAAVGWLVAVRLVPGLDGWTAALPVLGAVLAARLAIGLGARVWTIRPGGEGPLDRLAAQYSSRIHQVANVEEIALRTAEVLDLGLGAQADVLVPARDDWSWQRGDGTSVPDTATPDPLLVPWLGNQRRPIFLGELDGLGLDDLRPTLEKLLVGLGAQVVVPLIARDDLVGLLVIRERASGRAFRRGEMRLVAIVAERLAPALQFVRVAAEVAARAEVANEVELAAAVQTGFVPRPEPIITPAAQVLGTWQPTSKCGGDWWGVYALPGDRALVVIGDVTGSGVAAAMVTAAAKGACDVAVRVMGAQFDLAALLGNLDGAVRRVGAGRFHLTCFAAILDPAAGEVRFANAGHVVPYVCRPTVDDKGTTITLNALVARGNPLGAGTAPVTRAAARAIVPGDLIIWYTDGIVEARGADGNQFGDRRLQRALKRLDPAHLDPTSVHAFLAAELAAHLGGLPPGDDMTLVVARVEAPRSETPA